MDVSKSDFYALREFLDRDYKGKPHFEVGNGGLKDTAMMLGADRYLFTAVNSNRDEGYNFQFKRTKAFRIQDLVYFDYSNGKISVEKGIIKDEKDKEQVQGLVRLLNSKGYSQMIPNLNDLIK